MNTVLFSKFKNTKIGVVGMGYVGRNLVASLEKLNTEHAFEICTFNRSTLPNIKGQTFDYVFNCSGNTGDFKTQIWETVSSNLSVNQFIFENVTIKRTFVLLSSSRIYGFTKDSTVEFLETDPLLTSGKSHLDIDFVYNGTKMLTESVALNFSKNCPYKVIICRLSNLFGKYTTADLDDSTFLKLMLRHAIEKKSFTHTQNVLDTKGYVYIEDAIDGILLSATQSKQSGIFNICSGKSYSIKNWLDYLKISSDSFKKSAPPMHSIISIKKAQSQLGYVPKYVLDKLTISQIIQL